MALFHLALTMLNKEPLSNPQQSPGVVFIVIR
jgi:hypothetical protein